MANTKVDLKTKKLSELLESLNVSIVKDYGTIPLGTDFVPDDYLLVKIGKKHVPLIVVRKGHVDNLHQIKTLTDFSKNFSGMSLLVAELIENSIKDHLKKANVGFCEMGKEVYFPISLKINDVVIKTGEKSIVSKGGFRTESSLKLLFYFIVHQESRNFTQRQLSEKLGISLGALNAALKNLEKNGSLVKTKNEKWHLANFKDTVDRWRLAYKDSQRVKLSLGRFAPIKDDFYTTWKEIDLEPTSSYWGGENAAALLTGYLKPGHHTIYTYETQLGSILKLLRLKKDPNGSIDIVKAFWPEEINQKEKKIVPLFLSYCELLNSGVDRNLETAELLKELLMKELNI